MGTAYLAAVFQMDHKIIQMSRPRKIGPGVSLACPQRHREIY